MSSPFCLGAFLFGLSGMFGIAAGFGKVRIGVLDSRILIAVPELTAEGSVAWPFGVLLFDCPIAFVLISVLNHQ